MRQEVKIPNAVGFCKHCFRDRRDGSAYCGKCQNEPARMKVYWDEQTNFPLLKEVIKKFGITEKRLNDIIFTYGDTFYSRLPLSYGLVAHEITHTFRQLEIGKKEWWKKYISDDQFRLDEEIKAYRQQLKAYKRNDIGLYKFMIPKIAEELSSNLYGNITTKAKAIKALDKI